MLAFPPRRDNDMSGNQELIARRERLLGRNMSLFYQDPVHLVKGEGVWLWDADGRKYLDCYNNVPHVGHCHPRVVEAICRQASTLNTHTRYLHEGILDYVERLTATFDKSLDAAILTCTGSEANDVALRMAQAVTGKTGIIATDFTYHGNTTAVSQLSTRMPPVGGYGGHVRHVPAPDSYRPLGGKGGEAFAQAWAAEVEKAIASLQESPFGFSGLIIDPFFANEGFPDLPENFLAPAVAAVRKAGGVVIADEVQPGFGRTGGHMWGAPEGGHRAGYRDTRQTDGQWPSGWRGGCRCGYAECVPQGFPLFQHFWRQSGFLCCGNGCARRAGGGKTTGQCVGSRRLCTSGAGKTGPETWYDRQCSRQRAVFRCGTCSRSGGKNSGGRDGHAGCERNARTRRADEQARHPPERHQDQAAHAVFQRECRSHAFHAG
ncbi:omega-amino acid-pyruvate aminotransferase [Brucella sp. NVSL 07-0026]|nr:omega-amino acid-pyruvate aminotransferase [Brucella sp. NVSL 07-0026]